MARDGGLWQHRDFTRLWAAQTISVFGSLITGTALPFTAILALHASPLQVALLSASGIVPGLVAGLIAGVWVDRLQRRPLMIAADIGRALLLATIPLAYALDALRIEQLFAVAFAAGILTVFFDVAYHSYLPAIVEREELLEGNAKLTASSSVSEFAGFSVSGFLVQLVNGPFAIFIDALTFVASAIFVRTIRTPEPPPAPRDTSARLHRELVDGIRFVVHEPLLRSSAGATVLYSSGFGMFGATYMLFVTRGLGFHPGVLGVIFGLGGISSLAGAVLAGRAARRAGIGASMILGVGMMGLSMMLIVVAPDAGLVAAALLIGQQLSGDGGFTVFQVNEVSLRQSITPERFLGRVNSVMHNAERGFLLAGTLAGGVIGETLGLRTALGFGAALTVAASAWMLMTPLARLRSVPDAVPAPLLDTAQLADPAPLM